MSPDHALALLSGVLQAAFFLTAPLLAACLVGGVAIGVVQTATQVNEASISYVVKAALVVVVLLAAGPKLVDKVTQYTKDRMTDLEHVIE